MVDDDFFCMQAYSAPYQPSEMMRERRDYGLFAQFAVSRTASGAVCARIPEVSSPNGAPIRFYTARSRAVKIAAVGRPTIDGAVLEGLSTRPLSQR